MLPALFVRAQGHQNKSSSTARHVQASGETLETSHDLLAWIELYTRLEVHKDCTQKSLHSAGTSFLPQLHAMDLGIRASNIACLWLTHGLL